MGYSCKQQPFGGEPETKQVEYEQGVDELLEVLQLLLRYDGAMDGTLLAGEGWQSAGIQMWTQRQWQELHLLLLPQPQLQIGCCDVEPLPQHLILEQRV